MPPKPLPSNPLTAVRKVIRDGRDRVGKAQGGIRSLADEIRGIAGLEPQPPTRTAGGDQEPPSPPGITPNTSVSKLTNDEILAYQNREIGRELWQLEKHLSQGCRIPDNTGNRVACDCCDKGTFISGLAYESIPIAERGGKPSDIYARIARWAEGLEPQATVAAVESGQYDYNKLSGQASALRKELMGTLSISALTAPKAEITLEQAQKMAAEQAAGEVARRWESPQKT